MSENFLIIDHEKCYNTYHGLGLNDQLKRSSDSKLDHVVSILKKCGVNVHTKPTEKEKCDLWISESKRLTTAFGRMKQGIPTKKFKGVFYDSRLYECFATYDKKHKNINNNEVRSFLIIFCLLNSSLLYVAILIQ